MVDYLKYYEYLVSWLQEKVHEANAKGVIIGISGGIDSALVASIAKQAFPNNSLGILMPISSRIQDEKDGLELCHQIDLEYQVLPLKEEFAIMSKKLSLTNDLTKANLQARLRMMTLYGIAQEKGYLVLGTDNYAEYYLGYFTKYGDGGCDLLPIINLHKSEVFALANLLKLPKNIINKAPSAGLWDNQEDEKELGFTYNDFESFIKNQKIDPIIETKIKKQHQITEHKRNKIPFPLGIEKYLKESK